MHEKLQISIGRSVWYSKREEWYIEWQAKKHEVFIFFSRPRVQVHTFHFYRPNAGCPDFSAFLAFSTDGLDPFTRP